MASGDELFQVGAESLFLPTTGYAARGSWNGADPALFFDGSSTTEECLIKFFLQPEYDGNGMLIRIAHGKNDANSGNVVWFARARRCQDNVALGSYDTERNSGAVATAGGTDRLVYDTITLNDSDLDGVQIGECLEVSIRRVPTDAGDTKSGDACIVEMQVTEA